MRETNSLRFNMRPEARERYTARRKTDFDNGAIASNIPKSSDRSADRAKDLAVARDRRSRFARARQVQGKKQKKRDGRGYISRPGISAGIHLVRITRAYSGHAMRFSTLLQLCNASAAPLEP